MGEHVLIEHGSRSVEAYTAGNGGPGVLMYMDAIGLRPQIERMADRIASWGYVVLAPNIFWRYGSAVDLAPKEDLRDPANRAAFFAAGAMDRVYGTTVEQVLTDADVWLGALDQLTGQGGRVAAIGYCFGGRLALRTAAHRPDRVGVVGMFHTGGIVTDAADSPHLVVGQLSAFVLAGHADGDRSNTPAQITAFDDALSAAGVEHRTSTYPGAPHGFTMSDTCEYQEAGAERHFTELHATLDAHLCGATGDDPL